MRAEAAALPELRANNAARSDNHEIWRPAGALHFRVPSLWRVAHWSGGARIFAAWASRTWDDRRVVQL